MSEAESGQLLTLTEVSKRTNVSMPTLQRYKKLYQDRIPSVGTGRSQRYPEEALDVFLQLKQENIGKRGRPRKSESAKKRAKKAAKRGRPKKRAAAKRKKRRAAAKKSGNLLTLTEIARRTDISYPTLLRYTKSHLDEIPHEGEGRSRRFKPGAVKVFQRLRSQSSRGRKRGSTAKPVKKRRGRPPKKAGRRGRPPKSAADAAVTARLKELEKTNKQLERKIAKLEKTLHKPFKVVLQRK